MRGFCSSCLLLFSLSDVHILVQRRVLGLWAGSGRVPAAGCSPARPGLRPGQGPQMAGLVVPSDAGAPGEGALLCSFPPAGGGHRPAAGWLDKASVIGL